MAKVKGKGSKLQHTLAMSLTDIAQSLSIEWSGAASETYKSTSLDTGPYHTYEQTGYAEPGQVTMELFYDPALAGHQAITDLIDAPADNAMKLIYSDSSEQSFTQAGVQFGVSIVLDDGIKGTVTYQVDGDPGWTT